MTRVWLLDVNGSPFEELNYDDKADGGRQRDIQWQGVTYRQQTASAAGWTYQAVNEPPAPEGFKHTSPYLSVPPEIVKARQAAAERGRAVAAALAAQKEADAQAEAAKAAGAPQA